MATHPSDTRPWRAAGALTGLALPVIALAVAVPARSSARATGADPLPAVAAALARARSYQAAISAVSTGPAGAVTVAGTVVVVRAGGVERSETTLTTTLPSGRRVVAQILASGGRVCTRRATAGPYACARPSAVAAAALNLDADPSRAFRGAETALVFTRVGARRVGGQTCDAYAFTVALPALIRQRTPGAGSAAARGVLAIAPATGRPCREDQTLTLATPGVGRTSTTTTRTTTTWSRFDNARLRVPPVPGASGAR